MGIGVNEWPPGAFEQASLIARSLLECSHGNRPKSRRHLSNLIAAIILQDCPDDAGALADQVLAQPELADLARLNTDQWELLNAVSSLYNKSPSRTNQVQDTFEEAFGHTVGAARLLDTCGRANQDGTKVDIVEALTTESGEELFYLRVYNATGEYFSTDPDTVLQLLLPYV